MSMQQKIVDTLETTLKPDFIQIFNESHMHSRGEDTHFKVILVSPQFDGMTAVRRHQAVYASLGELMQQFHALAVHTYTPQEWEVQKAAPASPACGGGGLHQH